MQRRSETWHQGKLNAAPLPIVPGSEEYFAQHAFKGLRAPSEFPIIIDESDLVRCLSHGAWG